MNDDDFLALIDLYTEIPVEPNPDMQDVQIEWVRDNMYYGSQHILDKHDVTEQEVEEVLFEIPPYVKAKRHPEYPNRTLFWGATRADRELFIVCEDKIIDGIRYLIPITAFEPDDGEKYWRKR
jgi:hypothetical protein